MTPMDFVTGRATGIYFTRRIRLKIHGNIGVTLSAKILFIGKICPMPFIQTRKTGVALVPRS